MVTSDINILDSRKIKCGKSLAIGSISGKVRTRSSNNLSKFRYFLYFSVLLLSVYYFILRMPVTKWQEKCPLFNQVKETLVLLVGITHRRNLLNLAWTKEVPLYLRLKAW